MANTVQRQIRARIDRFVAELAGLVREAALASVIEAFGAGPSSPAGTAPARRPPRRARATPIAGRPATKKKRRKRDASSLAALTEKLVAYVTKNPGKRIEEIAKSLGTTTKALKLPMQKLVRAKHISASGVKRATTYRPA